MYGEIGDFSESLEVSIEGVRLLEKGWRNEWAGVILEVAVAA
jgi:hypothetical protein